ncbi:MAG: DUF4132 domain-containing protein [Gemmataceae bacterium]
MRLTLSTLTALNACHKEKDEITTVFADLLAGELRSSVALEKKHVPLLIRTAKDAAALDELLKVVPGILAAIQRITVTETLSLPERKELLTLRKRLAKVDKEKQKTASKLGTLIDQLCDDRTSSRLHPDEGWADDLRSWLDTLKPAARDKWETFLGDAARIQPEPPGPLPATLTATDQDWNVEIKTDAMVAAIARHVPDPEAEIDEEPDQEELWEDCRKAQLARVPAVAWRRNMAKHVKTLRRDVVAQHLQRWLHAVPGSKPGMLSRHSLNRELLRGLLWLCVDLADDKLAPAIQHAARFFYANKSGLADASIAILFQMATGASASALVALSQVVRFESQQAYIETALTELAEKIGVDRDELGDDGLPTFDFTEFGKLTRDFGDVRAELSITKGRAVQLEWSKAGKPVKSVPAAVKRDQGEDVETLKATVKGVREALSGLSGRLEASFLSQRKWQLEPWRKHLIEHPVAGVLGRKLIWCFADSKQTRLVCWRKGGLIGQDGQKVNVSKSGTVSLWHPLDASADEVLSWRERLEADDVTQPFKQAHREIYKLTDAERRTSTYSNRFAAHIVRQAQFRQLAKARGWKSDLVGPWDGGAHKRAERRLRRWGLRAEFWISGAGDDFQTGYTYVATDQVRFYPLAARDNDTPLPLSEVPPLVFCEILRDVDLFVSVASVGNNPDWADGGPNGYFRDYWHDYSFGALRASGETRRTILERIIPRLGIAARCKLTERFLTVRGELHSYKIHLGSGHILMSPNDQYLCIVPQRDSLTDQRIFLPFEGDSMLSVILSKALLLAEDKKITDPDIKSQL